MWKNGYISEGNQQLATFPKQNPNKPRAAWHASQAYRLSRLGEEAARKPGGSEKNWVVVSNIVYL